VYAIATTLATLKQIAKKKKPTTLPSGGECGCQVLTLFLKIYRLKIGKMSSASFRLNPYNIVLMILKGRGPLFYGLTKLKLSKGSGKVNVNFKISRIKQLQRPVAEK